MNLDEMLGVDPFVDRDEGYKRYRGQCHRLAVKACELDPTLTLVRGHYWCPFWNTEEPHWWTQRQGGTVYDPARLQFPSRGSGEYTPFNGMVSCAECGKEVAEENADIDGNYAFCSHICHGRFVGVY